CLLVFLLVACGNEKKKEDEKKNKEKWGQEFWLDDFFIQTRVDASKIDKNLIRANISGRWDLYEVKKLPSEFVEWSFNERIDSLEKIQKGKMPSLAGAHNGIVATYGYQRQDSQFKLNNAIKGMGFLPKKEKLAEVIELLETTQDKKVTEKLEILKKLYNQGSEIWDISKLVSLELYSRPERGTQTFLNQMNNPVSVIVFMDIPTYKLKTISYLLHPQNSELNDYEENVVKFVNLMHDYFHGESGNEFPPVIYNVIEVYNSSPNIEEGRGTRIE
ncbi:MAG: hypothetical protein SVM86_01825, partial [Candidatus Cloacimonadota bacterium]|nr:hypothetical protein [Candidatus Cloacimonadota bacterium]